MASTSAFEIGFAAATETVDVPADGAAPALAADGEGAVAEPADGEGADEPAAAVTLVACLEPKMADTILPKTLISSSYICFASRPLLVPDRNNTSLGPELVNWSTFFRPHKADQLLSPSLASAVFKARQVIRLCCFASR